ncbi:MAG: ABC transporter permease [Peptococcaceae bacterium]|nr:ABC transporter permease [Peptococcaceae bacterium]
MLERIKNIATITYIEGLSILRDKTLAALVLGSVFIYLAGFGLVYKSAILFDIPVAVVDQDQSYTSRGLVAKIANNPKLKVVYESNSPVNTEKLLQAEKIRAIFVIPERFEQDIARGQAVKVSVAADGTNLIYTYNLKKAISDLNRSLGTEIMTASLLGAGLDPSSTAQVLKAVDFESQILYNPTNSYINFLFLLLIILALQQTCLLGEGITLSGEKAQGTWTQFALSPLSPWEIFAGKALIYYLAVLFNAAVALLGAFALLKLPVNGSILLLFFTFAVFALSIIGMGFWLSSHCKDSMQATMVISLFNIPMLMGSGLNWPFSSMSSVVKYIAFLFPYTWMAHAARAITLKGAGITLIWPDLAVLAAMAIVFIFGAVKSVDRFICNQKGVSR